MTQRLQAEHILSKFALPADHQVDALAEIVGQAQNGPPHGEADGSVNERAWTALRDAVQALRLAKANIKTFRAELS